MDRTSWIAVIICFLLLLGWGPLVNHFYPNRPGPALTGNQTASPPDASGLNPGSPSNPAIPNAPAPAAASAQTPALLEAVTPPRSEAGNEQRLLLENDLVRVEFSSLGGAIRTVSLKEHRADGENPVVLNGAAQLPLLNLRGWDPQHDLSLYTVDSADAQQITFSRQVQPGVILTRTYKLGPDYRIDLSQTVFNRSPNPLVLPPYTLDLGTATSVYQTSAERPYVGVSWHTPEGGYTKHKVPEFDGFHLLGIQMSQGKSIIESKPGQAIQWASLKSQFFAVIVDCIDFNASHVSATRRLFPELRPKNEAVPDGLVGELTIPGIQAAAGASYKQDFLVYAGPKEDRRLRTLPDRMDEVMEFGWMAWISRPLLTFMNLVHSFVGNYGLTIIILTVLIKAVLWWPQGQANKSMKRMQTVAPLIKELQDKYKDNPTKLNEEMLKVYQDYGVNPLGGCLPMLLQFPVFLGFYYMLLSATELRHAGFLWIHDLSKPDTIFHLPIPGLELPVNPMPLVMAATMYWSMQITPQPQGVDNPSMKILKFMPLIFLLFCYNFSSALSLYWTVQNLLSIVQIKVNMSQAAPTLEALKVEAQQRRKARKARGKFGL
ncbi:MAG: membrane protein insertase YidC [Candidatus Methylacidiphilales bacterium]|nr:membrane protein insertase YidC [Candidatus Methylacidiphilales bacterium]